MATIFTNLRELQWGLTNIGRLVWPTRTAARTITLPDRTGTVPVESNGYLQAIAGLTPENGKAIGWTAGAIANITLSPSGYTRVNPRDREFENRAISTSGESIALSSIPSTGDCIVWCAFNPGLAAADALLSIVFASPTDSTKPVPTNANLYAGTSVWESGSGHYASQGYLYANGGHIWIPANNGSIWARRAGTYLDATAQSTLDVLGYLAL